MSPKNVRDAVGVVLRKDGERFREVGGGWSDSARCPRRRGRGCLLLLCRGMTIQRGQPPLRPTRGNIAL